MVRRGWFYGMVLASMGLHVLALSTFEYFHVADNTKNQREKIKIQIVEKKPAPPPEVVVPPPPKPKEKPLPKIPLSERKPKTPPPPSARPIQGLSKDAVKSDGEIAVPVGNTLMREDEGIRDPNAAQPLAQDLSQDAQLISSSITRPEYTQDALDAELEGVYTIEVLVDQLGRVTQAELDKKPGFGMDENLIKAAMKAMFKPRVDKQGRPVSGWTELKFKLEIN